MIQRKTGPPVVGQVVRWGTTGYLGDRCARPASGDVLLHLELLRR